MKIDVALQPVRVGGELAEIDAAQPIVGNLAIPQRGSQAQSRTRFGRSADRAAPRPRSGPSFVHQPPAVAAVVAEPIDVESKSRRGIRADVKANRLARAHAGVRAITFDPRAAIFGRRIDARVREHPVARAGLGVLAGGWSRRSTDLRALPARRHRPE